MQLSDFTGKPCRSKTAYEFLPNKKMAIDLEKTSTELPQGVTVEVKTKVLLMLRVEHCTVSLFPSGKLLVRGEREEEKAKKIAERVLKTVN